MLLMHASPLSSTSLRGAMKVFGQDFTCFALDNPGFGLSEPLQHGQGDMLAQGDALKQTIEAFGFDRPIVYGAATGGAIAHAMGSKYPDIASLTMLDTFSHHDTEDILEGYFPDVTPRRDGSHLLASWEKISGLYLFAPWQKAAADRRQQRDLPSASILHDMVMQQLLAGANYKDLYIAAIAWENKDNVDRLKAPTTLNVWEGASGLERVRMLIDSGLPPNYTPIYSSAQAGRYKSQLDYLLDNGFDANDPVPAAESTPTVTASYAPLYVSTGVGDLFAYAAAGASGKPLVLLHDWGSSGRVFDDLATSLADHHALFAPDLPSHGDSPMVIGNEAEVVTLTVRAIEDSMTKLGISNADVIGIGGGFAVAKALQKKSPTLVDRTVCLATAPLVSNGDDLQALRQSALSLVPEFSGAHLIRAFSIAKQQSLFWTWWRRTKDTVLTREEPLNPGRLHQATLDLLRARNNAYIDFHSTTSEVLKSDNGASSMCLAPDWRCNSSSLVEQLPSSLADNVVLLPEPSDSWGSAISQALSS